MNCSTSGRCEDKLMQNVSKSDRLYCMEECQKLSPTCQFSSYSEAENRCLLFKTCYKFNKNESLFSTSKVSCDVPTGGTFAFISNLGLTKYFIQQMLYIYMYLGSHFIQLLPYHALCTSTNLKN